MRHEFKRSTQELPPTPGERTRDMDVPRIGSLSADSTSVDRLCRDRLIDNRGRMPMSADTINVIH